MALIGCPECKVPVSDKAHSCPHCGYPIQDDIEEGELIFDDEVEDATLAETPGATAGKGTQGGQADARRAAGGSTGLVEKRANSMALLGLIIGVTSVFLYRIGLLPIFGVVFSTIGLGTFKPESQKNRWMAVVGLLLSLAYTIMYLVAYGHL